MYEYLIKFQKIMISSLGVVKSVLYFFIYVIKFDTTDSNFWDIFFIIKWCIFYFNVPILYACLSDVLQMDSFFWILCFVDYGIIEY